MGVGLAATKSSRNGGGSGSGGAALDGRTRVLATHHVRWLQQCDRVLVLGADGEVLTVGPPADPKVAALLGEAAPVPQVDQATSQEDSGAEAKAEPDSAKAGAATAGAKDSSGAKKSDNSAPKRKGKLMAAEDREKGVVKGKIWATYTRAFGKGPIAVLVVLYLASQGLQVGSSGWLDVWSSASAKQAAGGRRGS